MAELLRDGAAQDHFDLIDGKMYEKDPLEALLVNADEEDAKRTIESALEGLDLEAKARVLTQTAAAFGFIDEDIPERF